MPVTGFYTISCATPRGYQNMIPIVEIRSMPDIWFYSISCALPGGHSCWNAMFEAILVANNPFTMILKRFLCPDGTFFVSMGKSTALNLIHTQAFAHAANAKSCTVSGGEPCSMPQLHFSQHVQRRTWQLVRSYLLLVLVHFLCPICWLRLLEHRFYMDVCIIIQGPCYLHKCIEALCQHQFQQYLVATAVAILF